MSNNISTSSNASADDLAGAAGLTIDESYRLLSSGRRRTTIDVLASRTGPLALADLAAAVAAAEGDVHPAAVSPETRSQVAVALHHNHLPMMDDAGVVDYDPDAHRVVAWRLPPY